MSVSLSVDGPGDAELISAVRGGDIDAYGELFARHVDSARRLARQLAGPADADDLVSDAFTKVLTVLQRGGGPDLAFRAYLLTAVRRLHVDKIRAGSRLRPVDDLTPFDPGLPFQDTAVEGFENAAAARAFASLPERWQMVLWHTEVEQQKPADIAPLLGMSANSVSALAYRAREGLRQAFLSQHATDPDDVDCAWTRDHMGASVRGGLSRRDAAKVDDHLAECRACAAVYLELNEVNSGLGALLAPLLLGTAGGVYLSSTGGGAAAGGAAGGTAGAAGGAAGGAGSSGFAAVQGFAMAHLGLTVVGGLAVAATAVAAVYGASQIRGHGAADAGSPPVLHHAPSDPSTQTGDQPDPNPQKAPEAGRSPNVVLSSTPATPSTGPSSDPSTGPSDGPSDGPSNSPSEPTEPTTGSTDPTTGPTDPTTGPTDPGGGDVSFTSSPPADPVFGSTYDVSASGRRVVFSIDPATTNNACTLTDRTVTFRHAGDCVIAADQGPARAVTHSTQTIPVPKGRQLITFSLPGSAQVGDRLPLSATGGGSGKPVTFSGNDACTVDESGTAVTMRHAAGCTVTAHQQGDDDYTDAPDTTASLDVAKGDQRIDVTSNPPTSPAFEDTYDLAATSTSGAPVAFSIDAQSGNACTLGDDGTTVTFHHAGACLIDADQAGDADYSPAPTTTQRVVVPKAAQLVTFASTAPTAPSFGSTYGVRATSTSGDPVTFSVDAITTRDACSLGQDGSTITFQHAGTCVIDADQAGTGDYDAAPTASQEIVVPKAAQSISFTSTPPQAPSFGDTYDVGATGGDSGNDVVLSSGSPDVCTVTGTSVTFGHAGTCVIDADQAGNGDYTAAATATQRIGVPQEAQAIRFTSDAPTAPALGSTYAPTATGGGSDNPVTFSLDPATTPAACTLNDARTTVTFRHVGTCVIDADQAGSDDYTAAPTVKQSITLVRSAQKISFTSTPPTAPHLGDTYQVSAVSSPGLPVTFSVDPTTSHQACTLSGSTVTFGHAGRCVIDADQAGNDDYTAAPTVNQTVTVPRADQTITFTSTPPADAFVRGTYTVAATGGDSGKPVAFGSRTPTVCTVSGSTVTFAGAGTCTVTADQPGNDDYNAAPTATQSMSVAQGADLSVDVRGGFFPNTVLVTVRGLPDGRSTLLTVASDPKVSGLTLGTNCVRLGDLGTCTVTSDPQTYLFAVTPPEGGPTTLTFTVAPVPGITDPDLSNNSRTFVIRP